MTAGMTPALRMRGNPRAVMQPGHSPCLGERPGICTRVPAILIHPDWRKPKTFPSMRSHSLTSEASAFGPTGQTIPVLVAAGAAAHSGHTTGPRVVRIGDGLEIGRRPRGEPGLKTWAVGDRRVSARHARVMPAAGGFDMSDLGSRNGTLADGQRVSEATRLRDGTIVFFGGTAAVFRMLSEEE